MSDHTDLVILGGGISGASLLYAVAKFTDVDDVEREKGYGGARPQIVDTESEELDVGEAKIAGDGIPFNITPSSGASTALKNAMTDARTVLDSFDADREFDETISGMTPGGGDATEGAGEAASGAAGNAPGR